MSVATKLKRLAVLTSATAVVLGGVAVTPASADVIEIPVSYKVAGTTTVKKTGSSMKLGPGTLKGNLIIDDQTGSRPGVDGRAQVVADEGAVLDFPEQIDDEHVAGEELIDDPGVLATDAPLGGSLVLHDPLQIMA